MTHSTVSPSRFVLQGVPRVHFYEGGPRCPEDICFPSCMRAVIEFMGDKDLCCKHAPGFCGDCKVMCTYSYMAGVTGAAFYLSWGEGWQGDNNEIMYMSDDPGAPFACAFEAAGYGYELLSREPGRDNAEYFRQRIVESLRDKGRPVLAFGIIGPPECCLVTGYDEGGDVLIGWNFFQGFPPFNAGVEFEPTGEFRKRDWAAYEPDLSFLLIGDKLERKPFDAIYRSALEWGLKVARTSAVTLYPGKRYNGLAAYTAWAEHLQRDADFVADEARLRELHDVHNNVVGHVAEARWYGGQFLIEAVNHVHWKMAEDLLHATACYAGEHELMWYLWDLAGGNGNPDAYIKFADPAVRRQMIPIIQEARAKDAQAANYIERALAK